MYSRKCAGRVDVSSWPHHLPSSNQKTILAAILRFFETARVVVRLYHVVSFIDSSAAVRYDPIFH
jgi:hypothetical protein